MTRWYWAVVMLVLCGCARAPGLHPGSTTATAEWITVPAGFTEFQRPEFAEANWKYSSMPIMSGQYTIGVGPYEFKKPDDGRWDYFSIDIEEPYNGGSMVLIKLAVPLEYVSEGKLLASAKDLVSFDPNTKIVTYNLGNGTFQCRLKPRTSEQAAEPLPRAPRTGLSEG